MRFNAYRIVAANHRPPAAAIAGIATVFLIVAIIVVAIFEMLPR